jgi:hypothetical protein
MLKDSVLSGTLSPYLDISPQHLITMSDGNQMYLLGWGGATTIGKRGIGNFSGFAYTSDGLLLAVRNSELCFINKDGSWEKLIQLPANSMSVVSGKEVIYLSDKTGTGGSYNTYAFAKAGRYKKLFSSPKPVGGICELGDSVYVAIENGVYSYSTQKTRLTLLLALEKGTVITSITADQVHEIIYFSTLSAVYACRKNTAVTLTKEFPGSVVKYFGNGLIIFNPQAKDIFRIVNVETSIEF